jgi:hypothetical protein
MKRTHFGFLFSLSQARSTLQCQYLFGLVSLAFFPFANCAEKSLGTLRGGCEMTAIPIV